MEKRISRYTIINEANFGTVLFNIYTCGLIKLDEKDSEFLAAEDYIYRLAAKNEDYEKILIDNGFLVDNEIDELALIKSDYYFMKYQKSLVSITINTGLICNCNCVYCYEGQKHDDSSRLTQKVASDIISFIIKSYPSNTRINLSFLGGEPLLCLDIIKFIYFELKENFPYVGLSLTTNGLLLNEENIVFLKDILDEDIQISIDGTKDYHDKKRQLQDGTGTYDILINNIKILQLYDMYVNIRTHIDDEFISSVNIEDWIKSIKNDLDTSKNIKFYLVAIIGLGQGKKAFDKKYMDYSLAVYRLFLDNGINILFDSYFKPASYCSTVIQNSFSIDCTGKIYKCWHDLTAKNFNGKQFGDIYQGIMLPKLITYIDMLDVFNEHECKLCKFLPLCYGGCPEYKNSGYHKCTPLKHYTREALELFMKIKKISN
jgi:uncharacterized protein